MSDTSVPASPRSDAAEPDGAEDERPLLVFEESDGLTGIVVGNALLTLLTLGIYRFWARTNVRRYLWSRVRMDGDGFEYTGTGGELFVGFLIVMFAVLLPYGVITQLLAQWALPSEPATVAVNAASTLVIFWLVGVGLYRARRYRLSRTRWRGIRAAQSGSAIRYGTLYLGWTLLLPLSLGWVYPAMQVSLQHRAWNRTALGGMPFSHAGGPRPLYRLYAVLWTVFVVAGALFVVPPLLFAGGFTGLLFVAPVLGSLALYFFASLFMLRELAYLCECLSIDRARFRFTATTREMVRLAVGNVLIMLATFGFGYPFVQQRVLRFVCRHAMVSGSIDFEAIVQSAEEMPGSGEGLVDAFDSGAI